MAALSKLEKMKEPDNYNTMDGDPTSLEKCCVRQGDAPINEYLNGYVRIISFKWKMATAHRITSRPKELQYVYEGEIIKGLDKYHGFGRYMQISGD